MRRGLRLRLALTHALVAVIAVAVVATIVFVSGERRFDRYLSEVQRTRSEAVVRALADTYRTPDGWDASAIYALNRVAMLSNVNVAVYSAKGQLLFTVEGHHMGQGMMGMGNMMGGGARSRDSQYAVQSYPVLADGEKVAAAEIYVPQNIRAAAEDAYQNALTRSLVIAALVAMFIAFLVSLVVSRRVTGPLEELTDAAQEVAQGNLDVRVAPRSEDEIGALAGAFNTMAERLALDEQWRRDMTADLSHELRTPLATIQARIEALEDGVLPATPENLRVIGEEVERLGRLLGALRNLSELESEDLDIEYERLDLDDVGRDAIARAEASFAARNVGLTADLAPAVVKADRDRLLQVAGNLLDNALKYTPAGGHVVLAVNPGDSPPSLAADGGVWAHLSVADSGPGIDAVDLPFVFDRFYRGKSARGAQGAGLGLAIVRGLVEAQGGAVAAGNRPEGGAVFTVYLPLAR